MLNKEDTWAQSSSFDSAAKKVSYSHWHSCKTLHSASMISKHQALQKKKRVQQGGDMLSERSSFHCDSQCIHPAGESLRRKAWKGRKGLKRKEKERKIMVPFPVFQSSSTEITKELPEDSRHPHERQRLSWPLQTSSSSHSDSLIRCLTSSLIKHLFLLSAVLPPCFVRSSIYHTNYFHSTTTSNLLSRKLCL